MIKLALAALALSTTLSATAAWNTAGDVLAANATLTLTTAFADPGDPDQPFNLSGTGAVDVGVLEAALLLPAYALDLSPEEAATEGSVAWQSLVVAAGDRLSFEYAFTTFETDFEDHAFVVLGDSVLTLATRTQTGIGSFDHVFATGGTVLLGLGVVDTVDYLGVSTLHVDSVMLTPVPEPASAGLMAAGLLALLGWVRRRTRQLGG